jgi:hypothetical protein
MSFNISMAAWMHFKLTAEQQLSDNQLDKEMQISQHHGITKSKSIYSQGDRKSLLYSMAN